MRIGLVVALMLLLAGCASPEAAPNAGTDAANTAGGPGSLTLAPMPLRFAVGNYESLSSYKKTFQPADACTFFQCSAGAVQTIDLTPEIPAGAPVELTITISSDGSVSGDLIYTDATPVKETQTNGPTGGNTISSLVTRSDSGTIVLQLRRDFNFRPPSPQPVEADVEVRSVVRADTLVAGIPAAVKVPAGSVLNFSGSDISQVALMTSAGALIRDVQAPFSLTIPNGTTGESILLVSGGDATVTGPNATMTARRTELIQGKPHDLTSGQKLTWSFETATQPLQMGIAIRSKDGSPGPALRGSTDIKVTSPANVAVIQMNAPCTGFGPVPQCNFNFIVGQSINRYLGEFLDEYLTAGAYQVEISAAQAQHVEAFEFVLVVV